MFSLSKSSFLSFFILLSLCLALFSQASFGKTAETCAACKKMDAALAKIKKAATSANKHKGTEILGNHKFSSTASVRTLEIASYTHLALSLFATDEDGASTDYFYQSYQQYPQEFESVIEKLSKEQQATIRDYLKITAEDSKTDSGK